MMRDEQSRISRKKARVPWMVALVKDGRSLHRDKRQLKECLPVINWKTLSPNGPTSCGKSKYVQRKLIAFFFSLADIDQHHCIVPTRPVRWNGRVHLPKAKAKTNIPEGFCTQTQHPCSQRRVSTSVGLLILSRLVKKGVYRMPFAGPFA